MENKKINILIYGMQNVRGGVEMYLYNFAKYCDKTKFALSFLDTQTSEMIYKSELEKLGCDVIKVNSAGKNFKACVNELKKIFFEKEYDYIYINVPSYSRFIFALQKAKNKKTKMVLHSHGMLEMKKMPIKSRVSHYAGKYFFKNKPILRMACGKEAGKFLFATKPFKVFFNGIEIDKFKYNEEFRNEIRENFNLKEDELIFGNIARLSSEKNHMFLLEVFVEILKLKPNSKLILVGDGNDRKILENRISELGIDENVILTGAREDAYKFYSALDAFIMPSIVEGFGISIAEAQANGLFCFGSDNLDKSTNLTGNVMYISLEKSPKEWAGIILENMKRDLEAINKFSIDYKAEESYRKIFKYFEENI